jgi:hypothetical protein
VLRYCCSGIKILNSFFVYYGVHLLRDHLHLLRDHLCVVYCGTFCIDPFYPHVQQAHTWGWSHAFLGDAMYIAVMGMGATITHLETHLTPPCHIQGAAPGSIRVGGVVRERGSQL